MAIASGTKLGPYEILCALGAGGMGEVYRARDTRLGREVAIKVLLPKLSSVIQLKARFEREARTISALNHPHICHLYDIGTQDGLEYLVMEYLEGETLEYRLTKGPVKQALDYAIHVCDALDKAHRQGIVHRDLKPGNIMLTKAGAKLMDFGLAKVIQETCALKTDVNVTAESNKLTAEGTIVGTFQYMAPEQLEGQPVDARTDIFAFGAVLYEMITGEPPFKGKSKASLIAAILSSEPPPISSLQPVAPPNLERLVRACLAKNPDDRFQTAHDVKLQLQWIAEGASLSSESRPSAASHRTRVGWLTTVIVVLVGVAFVVQMQRPSLPPSVVNASQITDDGVSKFVVYSIGTIPAPILTDGSRLYFPEAALGGKSPLVQVSVNGGETAAVDTPFPNIQPGDISPNGSEILVLPFVSSEAQVPLWNVPVPAGSPRRIGSLMGQDATWTPDGNRIVYSAIHDIFICEKDGGACRKLVTVSGLPAWMRWSPDGRVMRFTSYDSKTVSSSLWEISSDGSHLHPVLPYWSDGSICCGNWTPDGKYFIFQAMHTERTDIWAIREDAGWLGKHRATQLTAGPLSFVMPSPSRDGKKLYVLGLQPRGELVRYDQKSSEFITYFGGLSADGVTFSKDGKYVAYTGYPQKTLWRARPDGTEKLQLTFLPMRAAFPRWSPDGKQLVFTAATPGSPWKLYTIAAAGGSPEPLTSTNANAVFSDWSPRGDEVVYSGFQGFITPDFSHEPLRILDVKNRQVSTVPGSEGLICPRWSPDGRYLAATTSGQEKMMLFDFQNKAWQLAAGFPVACANWSGDGRYLYLDKVNVDDPGIFRLRISDRKIEKIADLKGFRGSPEWGGTWWSSLTPDNSPLLLRSRGSEEIYALDLRLP